MKASSNGGSHLRFGQLELDLSEEKLLRKGLPVHLANQPLQILAILLEQPGEVVSREALCARLWPDGTYVDFDEGLNTAIKKLRYALGDSSDNPTFIETIPRRGYRFIAPVHHGPALPDVLLPHDVDSLPAVAEICPSAIVLTSAGSKLSRRRLWLITLGIVLAATCWLGYRLEFPPALRVTAVTRLTTSSRLDPWGELASDGSRLFFIEREGDHWNDRQISVAGGESMPFGPTDRNTKIFAVSNDHSEILYAPFTLRSDDLALWSMPLVGGAPRRVGDILADAAIFSADGTTIAFGNSKGVFLANRDGTGVRQLAALPGCWSIAWSPDSKILRFDCDGHLWQVSRNGRELHQFLPSWTAREGHWTSDGSYYIFTASKDGRDSLWSLAESPALSWLRRAPTQLTFSPISYACPLPSRDGHSVYAFGGMTELIDSGLFDPSSHHFRPVLSGLSVAEVTFSPDREWMAYSIGNQLWRSHPDGSDRRLIAGPPSILNAHGARWSPDSKRILFTNTGDGNRGTIYLVSADGGPAQSPLKPDPSRLWPDWSPDGKTMAYSVEERTGETTSSEQALYIFDFERGISTTIPGSQGLSRPRWSPDGRFLAAPAEDYSRIKLLDLKTHRWTEVARGILISTPVWSPDSVLYFQDILAPGEPVYRFQPGSSAPHRVYSFEEILDAGALRCAFWGFAPDGSLIVQVNRGGGDIYALTVTH